MTDRRQTVRRSEDHYEGMLREALKDRLLAATPVEAALWQMAVPFVPVPR